MTDPHSVIIDGVEYAPAKPIAQSVHFYFMYDCHLFSRLDGKTPRDIVAAAKKIQLEHKFASYGSLCPAVVMGEEKEIRRVGPMIHSRRPGEWNEAGLEEWIAAIEADPDICRIMQEA